MHHEPQGGVGESKSLLSIKAQKRGSFMTFCHEPNGRNICFYSITHWGYSDVGGGVWGVVGNRLTSGKETRTSHKEHNFLVTGNPWAL